MAGEDESKDLQDQKDGRFYENTLADEGGTGQLAGYNDDFVDELTDTDERPAKQSVQQGNDASSEFANFGNEEKYTNQFGDDEADDDENFNGDDEDFDNDAEDFDGDDDDYDNEYGYDDYDDDDEDDEDDEDEDENNEEDDDEDGEGGGKGEKGKKDKNKKGKGNGADKGQFTKVKKRKISPEERAAMKAKKDEIFAKKLGVKFIWHEGEEIKLETLQQYWSVFAKHVEDVRELMKRADELVDMQLRAMTCGPNLILNFNKFLTALGSSSSPGMIQSLLNLIARPGVTLLYGVWAAVEGIFDQQWQQVALIFGLKTGMQTVLKIGIVQELLQNIFSMGMKKLKKKFNYKGIVVVPK